jgi:hypothetical protein
MAKKVTVNKAYVEKFVLDNGYPERGSLSQEELQKFYKHCTDEQLADWMALEGLTHSPSESAPINRMRMAMAILYAWYPKEPSAKKKSKYADYSLEQLVELAIEKDVAVETTDNERIMRMRTIMALRAAGHIV